MFSLTTLQTVATFIIILGILVFFHELGHFWVAKLFRMRVEEFALGFGPRLLRVGFDGQTEYNIRAVPLGGFVRIAGMEIEDAMERRLTGTAPKDSGGGGLETTNVGLIEQEAAEVSGTEPDGFNNRPVFQRFLVILAGPVFSVLLGWLAFCLVGAVYGIPNVVSTPRIEVVVPGGPAAQAGLKSGDTVISVAGKPVQTGEELVRTVRGAIGKPLLLTVRDAKNGSREVSVTPRAGEAEGKRAGVINIQLGQKVDTANAKRVGLGESFAMGSRMTVSFFEQFGRIFSSGRIRDNLGGPVAIAQATGVAVKEGGPMPLLLLAQLSLSIGLFNLFPIPVLDGGHIVLLTLEAVRGRKLTAEQTQRVLTTGLAIIAVLFLYVMFNDITRLFRRG